MRPPNLLQSLLYISKRAGLQDIARLFCRYKLRILCYHGFSYADEHRYKSGLFMTPDTFRRRMQTLAQKRYRVIHLNDALRQVSEGCLARDSVVLTFDDGWQGIADFATPVLREHGFPATIYVTSYYVRHQIPLVNILVFYIAWKAVPAIVSTSSILPGQPERFDLTDQRAKLELSWRVINHCNQALPPGERLALCRKYARALGVDIDLVERGAFRLMSPETLRQLSSQGFDIQLHSHRHRGTMGPSSETIYEIERNKEVLRECTDNLLIHFCYPGGRYSADQIPVLRELGICSATTTRPGLVGKSTSHFELPRILDGEELSQDKFEAMLSGAYALFRH